MNLKLWIAIWTSGLFIACTPNAKSGGAGASTSSSVGNVLRADAALIPGGASTSPSGLTLSGPQVGMINVNNTFALAVPNGVTVTSAVWNFGDGSPTQSSLTNIVYAYVSAGTFTVRVEVTLGDGSVLTLSQSVQVLSAVDGMECVNQLTLTGASAATVGQPASFTLTMPSCLDWRVGLVSWNFGDGSANASGLGVSHTFGAAGADILGVTITLNGSSTPLATLTAVVAVTGTSSTTTGPSATTTGTTDPSTGTDSGASSPGTGASAVVSPGSTASGSTAATPPNTTAPTAGTSNPPATTTPSSPTPTSGGVAAAACADFGASGTVKSAVVIGQIALAHACAFGETGITDVYTQVADQTCTNGAVVTSNPRTGSLITAGVCPTYAWASLGSFGACSADCGGTQALQYACVDNQQQPADSGRCAGAAPTTLQACDANAAAAAYTTSTIATVTSGAPKACPANQIGTVVQSQDVTTTTTYACVNHQMVVQSTDVSPGPVTTQANCQDETTVRCSNEQLTPDEARARYAWMKRCERHSGVLKRFVEQFDRFAFDDGRPGGMCDRDREAYAVFMIRRTGLDAFWSAPRRADGPCELPAGAFVAASCGLGGALPDQEILSPEHRHHEHGRCDHRDGGLGYTPIAQAADDQYRVISTLFDRFWFDPRTLAPTHVARWTTQTSDQDHDILTLTTRSGRALAVTPNHLILAGDGTLRAARDWRRGDFVVHPSGRLDEVVRIEPSVYHGKVYNVFTRSDEVRRNVMVTNGIMNATANLQGDLERFVNRRLQRDRFSFGACGR